MSKRTMNEENEEVILKSKRTKITAPSEILNFFKYICCNRPVDLFVLLTEYQLTKSIDIKKLFNIKLKDKTSPLGLAIIKGFTNIVYVLLDFGIDPNKLSFDAIDLYRRIDTPLNIAIRKNNLEIVSMLLEYGANYNYIKETETPLKCAIDINNPQIVSLLLKYGANCYIELDDDQNLFHYCIYCGYYEIVEIMIKHDKRLLYEGYYDREKEEYITPLMYAIDTNNKRIIELLIKYGESPFRYDCIIDKGCFVHALIYEYFDNLINIILDNIELISINSKSLSNKDITLKSIITSVKENNFESLLPKHDKDEIFNHTDSNSLNKQVRNILTKKYGNIKKLFNRQLGL